MLFGIDDAGSFQHDALFCGQGALAGGYPGDFAAQFLDRSLQVSRRCVLCKGVLPPGREHLQECTGP